MNTNIYDLVYDKAPISLMDNFSRIIFDDIGDSPMGVDVESRVLLINPNHVLFTILTDTQVICIIKHERGHLYIAPVSRAIEKDHVKQIQKVIANQMIALFLLEYVYNYIVDTVNAIDDPDYPELSRKRDEWLRGRTDLNPLDRCLSEAQSVDIDQIHSEKAKKVRQILDERTRSDSQYLPIPEVVIRIYELLKDDLKEAMMNSCVVCPFSAACNGNCVFKNCQSNQQGTPIVCNKQQQNQQDQQQEQQQGGGQSQGQQNQQEQEQQNQQSQSQQGQQESQQQSQQQTQQSGGGQAPHTQQQGSDAPQPQNTSGQGDQEIKQPEIEGEEEQEKSVNQRRLENIRGRDIPGVSAPEVRGSIDIDLDEGNPVVQSLTFAEREELRETIAQQQEQEADPNALGGSQAGSFSRSSPSPRIIKALGAMRVFEKVTRAMDEWMVTKEYRFESGEPYDTRDMVDEEDIADVTDPMELLIQEETDFIYSPQIYSRRSEEEKRKTLILRDRSGSISGSKHTFAESTVVALIEICRKKGMRVGYGEFNTDVALKRTDGKVFTKDCGELMMMAISVYNTGGTDIPRVLAKVITNLNDTTFDIILISDGESAEPPENLIHTLRKRRIRVYPIFIGGSGAERLKRLAERTKGVFYKTKRVDQGNMLEIVMDLKQTLDATYD